MKYLKIANEGQMEVGALTLLGGSSKRGDDSKIGMFGSGNKYALAYFLRNEIDIKIYSGTDEIKLSAVPTKFRDQEYDVIHVNGLPTSITTGSGPKWEFWHSIREIYSNALDEGFIEMRLEDDIMPLDGETHFYIEINEDTKDFYENIDKYFSKERDFIYTDKNGSILPRKFDDFYAYRMGIRCFESKHKSLFDYNFMDVEISEARVANAGEINRKIAQILFQCSDEHVIKKYYKNSTDFDIFENMIDSWTSFDASLIHENWLEYMPKKYIAAGVHTLILDNAEIGDCQIVSDFLYTKMLSRFGHDIMHPVMRSDKGNTEYRELEITDNETWVLEKAHEFLSECDFDHDMVEKIKVVKFPSATDSKIYGDQKLLCIDRRMFNDGLRKIVSLIVMGQFDLLSRQNGEYDIVEATNYLIGYMAKKNAILI